MFNVIRWYFGRLPYAMKGLSFALRKDRSFRWQVIIGMSGIALLIWLSWPVRELEVVLLVAAAALVLITELQNSALELTLNHLHPDHHETIGRAKDMVAASVLISLIFALAVTLYVLFW